MFLQIKCILVSSSNKEVNKVHLSAAKVDQSHFTVYFPLQLLCKTTQQMNFIQTFTLCQWENANVQQVSNHKLRQNQLVYYHRFFNSTYYSLFFSIFLEVILMQCEAAFSHCLFQCKNQFIVLTVVVLLGFLTQELNII